VDHLLHCGGHQDVALFKQELIFAVCDGGGPREALDGAVLVPPVFQLLRVKSVGVGDGSVPLNDTNTSGPSTAQVANCVKTDIAEALSKMKKYPNRI
jgi:hypothetical protein